MPELPEIEVLVRHLAPLLKNKTIRAVVVRRANVLLPDSPAGFKRTLIGARFVGLARRGKFLLFTLRQPRTGRRFTLVGHLGMTGRMYLQPADQPLPKHAAVVFALGKSRFVYEDTRYFGRLTLDTDGVARLGPEPLSAAFTADYLRCALRRSRQQIKVKLLDQTLVAGVGNLYASEVLFRAGISPKTSACRLTSRQVSRLWRALRTVLAEAIALGSTLPLDWAGRNEWDGLFYFGRAPGTPDHYRERLRVYDRGGEPCPNCGARIKRLVQASRSTFYCPRCQRA